MKKLYSILSVMFMALTATAQHEYVDLGLPSGTLWATCNIGADSPEESGNYFAWGETAPMTQFGDPYNYEGYDGSEGSPNELLPEDDAATANWGSEWQIPNLRQFEELVNYLYTTAEWTTMNGVSGCKITSKSNGNSIFLPAAGAMAGSFGDPESGYYWTRTTYNIQMARGMKLDISEKRYRIYSRTYGSNIRPVRVLEEKEHEYVDLGLPSGTMWATCNVGAFIPEEYGDYFHWGETEQKGLAEAYSFKDNPQELLPENDAATANWGGDWRMPSIAQIEELVNELYTTTEWTTLNGINGRKITSKRNGNSIFLPAAGTLSYTGEFGYYWSRSINKSDHNYAWSLRFDSEVFNKDNRQRGEYGSVRPVCFAKAPYTEFDESTGTLTYYFDEQRSHRTGIIEEYRPVGSNITDTRFNDYNKKVTKVVIDPSMKKAPLTSMRNMFYSNSYIGYDSSVGWTVIDYPLSNLTSIEGLENLNTENVTDMSSMFYGCEKLDTLDLSLFNTKKVTNMETMFCRCSSLTSLDLSSFNTEKVSDMSSMFSRCSSLTSLDLSSFNNTYVEDLNYMFFDCHELTTIYCNKDWSTSEATSDYMFTGCEKLVGGKGTPWSSSVTDKTYARPDRGENAPGYFTSKAIRGDVNGDGEVNSGDVVAVYSYIIKGAGSGFDYDSANVNGDSGVDSADVVAIYNIIIGN